MAVTASLPSAPGEPRSMQTSSLLRIDCRECGSICCDLPANPSDDCMAECRGCGRPLGRYGDLKAEAAKTQRERAFDFAEQLLARTVRRV